MVDGHESATDEEADDIVWRIMDKAQRADGRALFAALQAAVSELIDFKYLGSLRHGQPFESIEEAIDLGAEVGSPEHRSHMRAKWAALEARTTP